MSWDKTIHLKSSDGVVFDVEEPVILESPALKDYMNQNNISDSSSGIEISVNFETLTKVMEYCRRHALARKDDGGTENPDEDIEKMDIEFVKVDPNSLFHLIHAAHLLKIKSLMDLACQTFADMIENNKFDDIRQAFAEAETADQMFRKTTLCSSRTQGFKAKTKEFKQTEEEE